MSQECPRTSVRREERERKGLIRLVGRQRLELWTRGLKVGARSRAGREAGASEVVKRLPDQGVSRTWGGGENVLKDLRYVKRCPKSVPWGTRWGHRAAALTREGFPSHFREGRR